jgi:hypothetical protein
MSTAMVLARHKLTVTDSLPDGQDRDPERWITSNLSMEISSTWHPPDLSMQMLSLTSPE